MKKIYFEKNTGFLKFLPEKESLEDIYFDSLYITEEIYQKVICAPIGYKWRYVNNNFELFPYDLELIKQQKKQVLRDKREIILKAFDIYKINVFYGIDSDANHQAILTWYQAILDLDEEAIKNPPQEVRKYL